MRLVSEHREQLTWHAELVPCHRARPSQEVQLLPRPSNNAECRREVVVQPSPIPVDTVGDALRRARERDMPRRNFRALKFTSCVRRNGRLPSTLTRGIQI